MATPLLPPHHAARGVYYSVNNPFLFNGSKGFSTFKILENQDLYVRLDLPGVPEDGVKVSLDESKKMVIIKAREPQINQRDSSYRGYFTMTGLSCSCCEITDVSHQTSNGVLRLRLSKTAIDPHRASCLASFLDEDYVEDSELMGTVLKKNPYVFEGSESAYETNRLEDGKLHIRVDMPGVPTDKFNVSVAAGKVKVYGEAPAVSEDSSGRLYSGDIATLNAHFDEANFKIKHVAKNGVIHLIISI